MLLIAKPRPKPYKLTDSQSLYLTVSTSSAKLWYFLYCFSGKDSLRGFLLLDVGFVL